MGEKLLVNSRHAATAADLDSREYFGQLFVIPDCKLQMAGRDLLGLLRDGYITSLRQNLLHQVLERSCGKNGTSCPDSLSDALLLHKATAFAHLEQESSFVGPGGAGGFCLHFGGAFPGRHFSNCKI